MSREMPRYNDSLSSLADRRERLQTERDQYYKNLFKLRLQAAQHGVIDVPLFLQHEIAATESKLDELDKEIAWLRRELEIKIEGEEEEKQTREQEKDLFKRFWQIRGDEPLFCVISSVESRDTRKYKRRATGFGEIRGYASIVYSLTRAYERSVIKEDKLYFGDTFPDDKRRERSLILLGGDDKNDVTRQAMKRFELQGRKLPFRFHYQKDWRGKETGFKCLLVQDLEDKEEIPFIPQYKKVKGVNDESRDSFVSKFALFIGGLGVKVLSFFGKATHMQVVRDYGVMARLPNPRNPHSKLYIMAGCHTYGTAAAAKAVAAKAILRQIEKNCSNYLKRKFFVAVVRCHMTTENFLHVDRMEVFYPLHEKTLRPISEGAVRGVDFTVQETPDDLHEDTGSSAT